MVMPATSAVAARSEVRNIRLATFCEVREFCLLAVSWSGLNRSFKPGGRVERLSAATQFDIQLGSALRSVNHGAHRLAGLQPLSDHNVNMGKAGQHRMIAAAVLDDQYLAVGPEWPFEHDLAIEWGHHLGAGPRGDDQALAFAERIGLLPEFRRNLPARRLDQAADLLGKGRQVGRRRLQAQGRRGDWPLDRRHLLARFGRLLPGWDSRSGLLFGGQALGLLPRGFLLGGLGLRGLLPR